MSVQIRLGQARIIMYIILQCTRLSIYVVHLSQRFCIVVRLNSRKYISGVWQADELRRNIFFLKRVALNIVFIYNNIYWLRRRYCHTRRRDDVFTNIRPRVNPRAWYVHEQRAKPDVLTRYTHARLLQISYCIGRILKKNIFTDIRLNSFISLSLSNSLSLSPSNSLSSHTLTRTV